MILKPKLPMMDEHKPQPLSPASSTSSPREAKRENGVSPIPRTSPPSFFGKHRLTASTTHLENQIKIIQEELEELESVEGPSIVCEELISAVESSPDPLLPIIKGPADANWDIWFRGVHPSKSHKRWI